MSTTAHSHPDHMTALGLAHLAALPAIAPLHHLVRRLLLDLVRSDPDGRLLDCGGRKSPYTIGVPAQIIVSDLPRQTALQRSLQLGLRPATIAQLGQWRHNLRAFVFDDMTASAFHDASFDGVIAVEVLEHVKRYESFLSEVARVLKPRGFFVATTPNGDFFDFAQVNNPDNEQFFSRSELEEVLSRHFSAVRVDYLVPADSLRRTARLARGRSLPRRVLQGVGATVLHTLLAQLGARDPRPAAAIHLLAVATKGQFIGQ